MWCLQGNNKEEEKHRQETQSVLELLRRNDQAKHPKGKKLPHDIRLYRFDLIQSWNSLV